MGDGADGVSGRIGEASISARFKSVRRIANEILRQAIMS